MEKTDFSESGWYADVFRLHEIAFRIRAQRLHLPESMRSRYVGTVFHPGQEGYFEIPSHPVEDVLRAYNLGLLTTTPGLAAAIIAELKRRENSKRANVVQPKDEGSMIDKANAAVYSFIQTQRFWVDVIAELKKAQPMYFPSSHRPNETDDGHACMLLSVMVSGMNPTLDDKDEIILRALCKRRTPIKQVDLEVELNLDEKTRISRRTLGPHLEKLRDMGLIARPLGQRNGDAITPRGLQIIANLPVKPSH